MSETFGISELADEFGVTTRTVRFYEDKGLISPSRDGQRRIYSSRDRVRLRLIMRGKRLGFTLSEIAEILALYDGPRGEAKQLGFLLEKIAERRAELLAKRQDIEASLRDLDGVARNCRKQLRALKTEGRKAGDQTQQRRRAG